MCASLTKQAILERHAGNSLLAAPELPVTARDALDLSADHPTMPPDPAIVDFVNEGLLAGQTHYADVPGMPALRKALAVFYQNMGYHRVEMGNVLVTAGMQETRFLSLQTLGRLLGPVALPDVVHPGALKALGLRPVLQLPALPTERARGFLAGLAGIAAALAAGAKVLYLESPVRLTGAVYEPAEVARIAELAEQYQAAVIWDEGLAPWVPDYVSLWRYPGMEGRAVLLAEAFPGLGLESWYIGCIIVNSAWFEKLRRDKQAISICTSTPEQLGATKAGELYPQVHRGQLEALLALRGQAVSQLGARALPGAAASIVAVELADPLKVADLRKQGFRCADGADFGARGVVRLAVTLDNRLAGALAALR